MAKKKGTGKGGGEDDFDLSDLDNLDDGLDLGDMEDIGDDRNPSKLGVAKELSEEAGKGFLESLAKKTAKKSLPEEYEYNYSEAMDYADFGKEVFQTSKSRIERSVFKLGTEVKKLLPFQSKMLDGFLDKYAEENVKARQESEEAMREAGIQSNVASIFDKQLDVQKAIEARREAKDQVETKERLATNRISTNLLTSIDRNTAQQTAFTLQISKEYFRRSLELQYKSYFIQADMLKTMRDYYKGFSVQFESIAKNTGLPDYVKLQTSERLGEVVRNKAVEGVYKKLFSNSKYVENVKSKASSYISNKLEEKLGAIDGISDQLEMLNGATDGPGGAGRLLGGVFAGMGGSALGEKISDKISPKIKEKLKDNKYINTGANQLALLANSPTTFFANLRDKVKGKKTQYEQGGSTTDAIGSKVFGGLNDFLNVTTPGAMEYKVEKESILSHNKPAIFSNKTDRSITEVIPMYLAKILKESVDLNKMYLQTNRTKLKNFSGGEELVYDYEGRSLVTGSALVQSVQNNVLAKDTRKERTNSLSSTLVKQAKDNLSKDKKGNSENLKVLSDKSSAKILSEYLKQASELGIEQNYETLIDTATDKAKASPELSALIDRDPKLKILLESIKKSQTSGTKDYIDRSLADITTVYPVAALKKLLSDTSKLAQSKILNNINDVNAQILAKAFTKYIMETGDDVTASNVMSGASLRYIEKKQLDALKSTVGIFTSEIKRIKDNGGMVAESSLSVLFGLMNRSLRENFEVDPKVFQTLYDYSPVLGSSGKLSTENLVERKLGIVGDTVDYVEMSDLRSVTRVSKAGLEEARGDILNNLITSSFGKGVGDFTKDISEAGKDPRKIFGAITKHGKKLSEGISSKSKELYATASDKISEIEKMATSLTDKTAKEMLVKLTNKVAELETSLESLIETEKVAQREKESALNELKSKLSEVANDPSSLSSLEREIKISNAYYNDKIKILVTIKDNMSSQKSRLARLQESSQDKSVVDLIKEVRTILSDNLDKLKGLVEKAKAVEDRATESVM